MAEADGLGAQVPLIVVIGREDVGHPFAHRDAALRKAIVPFYPKIATIQLEDYKVRIINGQQGTGARTRVLITSTDGKDAWGTVGASDNVIEASWLALVDSFEYKLGRK